MYVYIYMIRKSSNDLPPITTIPPPPPNALVNGKLNYQQIGIADFSWRDPFN